SGMLAAPDRDKKVILQLLDACRRVGEHIGARAPIRIDSPGCERPYPPLRRQYETEHDRPRTVPDETTR
ncbi:MAG TPA: hypothetical protein VKZ61_11045, partial [Thermomicrobiales bacterium]|nr:hypothetical protein [Thermomicrobiales bacterium]